MDPALCLQYLGSGDSVVGELVDCLSRGRSSNKPYHAPILLSSGNLRGYLMML